MKRERPGAAQRFDPSTSVQIRRSLRGQIFFEIRVVETGPLFSFSVPPHKFLTLTPRFALGVGRGAIIDNATVIRPGKSPTVAEQILWIAFVCSIAAFLGKYAAVNPGTTSGCAVILQVLHVRQLLPFGQAVAIDLFENDFNIRLTVLALLRIIPSKCVQTRIPRPLISPSLLLQSPAQVIDEPSITAGVARRVDCLLSEL